MELSFELAVVRLFVRDWERAIRFYTDALGMTLESRSDEFGWAELGTGPCKLALERAACGDPETDALVGRFSGVTLRVPDLHATHRILVARGVHFLSQPEKQAWGGTLAHVRDPDGNVLTLLG